ncbi:hypothetical protein O5823_12715 [Escherichia coli]|nr:hypothetical protein [Escherichia coli]
MSSGVLGSLFCLFILYASQIEYVALIPILLTCGLPVFIWSRKEKMMVSRYLPKRADLSDYAVAVRYYRRCPVYWWIFKGISPS